MYIVQFYSLVSCDSTLQHVCIARLRKRQESVIVHLECVAHTIREIWNEFFYLTEKKAFFS